MTAWIAGTFEWIWTTTIMASVLALLIFLAKLILKDRIKPRMFYLLWVMLVVRLVIPWTPESSFSMFNLVHLESAANTTITQTERELPTTSMVETSTLTNKPTPVTENSPASVVDQGSPQNNKFRMDWLQVLPLLWLIGTVFMIIMMAISNVLFALKVKKQPRITDNQVLTLFKQCKNLVKLKQEVGLIETSLVSSPTLIGVLQPKLLLPREVINTLTIDQLRYVFLHELSHIKRKDIFVNWVMSTALALHWFNPLLWLAYHKMREDQEIACDSKALSYIEPAESKEYAYTIIKLLENFSFPTRFVQAACISGNKNQLKRRLIMVTTHKKNSYKLSLLGIAAVLLLGGCALTMPKSSEQPLSKSQGILKIDDVESVQIIGGLVDAKPRTSLYTNESRSGKQMISNVVSWVNAAMPVEGATEFGKHGYPDTIQIERANSSTVRINHAYNCVVSPVKENGTATKSCSPVDGEVVLTKDSVKTRLASSELFEWLKSSGSNDAWNNKEGFVIAKEGQKILMVRYDLGEKTVGQILKESQPNAIWIKVKDKSQYDSIVLGDKVSVIYEDMAIINQSYPAQTSSANEIIRITIDEVLGSENISITEHSNNTDSPMLDGIKPIIYKLDNTMETIMVYDFGSDEKRELGEKHFQERQQLLSSHAPIVYELKNYLILYYSDVVSNTSTPKLTETKYGEKLQKAFNRFG